MSKYLTACWSRSARTIAFDEKKNKIILIIPSESKYLENNISAIETQDQNLRCELLSNSLNLFCDVVLN